jgi:hypothetical protein
MISSVLYQDCVVVGSLAEDPTGHRYQQSCTTVFVYEMTGWLACLTEWTLRKILDNGVHRMEALPASGSLAVACMGTGPIWVMPNRCNRL